MKLTIHYDISAKMVLYDCEFASKLKAMKAAGVTVLWLVGYVYGRYDSSLEEMAKAKKILEENGLEVQVITVPLGHGGNALDPFNPDVNVAIKDNWNYTVDIHGAIRYCTTCIDDTVLADSREAAMLLRQIGITKIFYDDDLRQSPHQKELGGCFCDRCMEQFQKKCGIKVTRDDLARLSLDNALVEAWKDFTCAKIVRYLKAVTVDGITSGIMVMVDGDRRHGIDIRRIRQELPQTFFRVGEGHFDDSSFASEIGKQELKSSIHTHMALIRDINLCYSESTVYPAKALSPHHWIEKIRIEIESGLRNIFLMSGSWFLTPEYWEALQAALPELYELAANSK